MLSLEIDDSDVQTQAVLKKVAEVEGLGETAATIDYEPWQNFQRWLKSGSRDVVIPYAGTLARKTPARSVRLRRDFGQILRAVKAHALIHRNHREIDGAGRIVATLDDYAVVRAMMSDIVAETTGTKIKKEMMETIGVVAELVHSMPPDQGTTAQQVAKKLKLDKSAARRRLISAAIEGHVVNLETRKGHPSRYRVTGEVVDFEDVLPAVDELTTPST
jgi:hypothetical protein